MNLKTAVEQEETEKTENKELRDEDFRVRAGFPVHHPDDEANVCPFLALESSLGFLCLLLLKF